MPKKKQNNSFNTRKRKHVAFRTTPSSRYYTLNTSEISYKRKTPPISKTLKRCVSSPKVSSDFPCRKLDTVFDNMSQFKEYKRMKHDRNKSQNYVSKRAHYRTIFTMLDRKKRFSTRRRHH